MHLLFIFFTGFGMILTFLLRSYSENLFLFFIFPVQ